MVEHRVGGGGALRGGRWSTAWALVEQCLDGGGAVRGRWWRTADVVDQYSMDLHFMQKPNQTSQLKRHVASGNTTCV